MSEARLQARKAHIDRRMRAVAILNVAFSALMLGLWSNVPRILAEPVRWATWAPLGAHPDLFEFPFVMLWGLPLAGIAVAWPIRQGGSSRLAIWVASFPMLYIGTLIGGFYVIPGLLN
ncbi:MAG: hypothetical protein ABL904_07385 [Hyphomicrobiaceae bacterium]